MAVEGRVLEGFGVIVHAGMSRARLEEEGVVIILGN